MAAKKIQTSPIKSASFGPISTITAFLITLVPMIIGFSLTGNSIRVPAIGSSGNMILGWLLVLAGLFSVYTFIIQKK